MKTCLFFMAIMFAVAIPCYAQDIEEAIETNTIPGGNGYPYDLTVYSNGNRGTDASTQLLQPASALAATIQNLVSYKTNYIFHATMV